MFTPREVEDINARLDQIAPRSARLGTNPLGSFLVRFNDTTKGLTASFSINNKQGMSLVQLKRNFSRDPGTSKILQTWDVAAVNERQTLSYDDTDPDVRTNQNVYYWIDAVPLGIAGEVLTVGPQQFINNADLNAPDQIADFDASHNAVAGGVVNVAISFKAPANDRFGSCKIYVTGYKGVAASVALAQSSTSPWTFKADQTGETVTLTAIAVTKNGIEAVSGPTKTLTLGAAATVPAKIIGVSVLQLTTGAQIGFPAGAESNITQYTIWRAAKGAGLGGASSIGTVVPTGAFAYSFLDVTGLASPYDYFVLATNAIGNSTASTAANFADLSQVPDSTARLAMTAANTSYRPLTNPLHAHDSGAACTIPIDNFTMRCPGKGDIPITGANPAITALAYVTLYHVYYDDPNFAGGAVSFQATTTKETALNGSGRFYVGSVLTPTAGALDTTGNNDGGASAQIGKRVLIYPLTSIDSHTGTGAANSTDSAFDTSLTSFAQYLLTGNGSIGNRAESVFRGFYNATDPWKSLVLKVKTGIPQNSLNGGSSGVAGLYYGLNGASPLGNTIFQVNSGATRGITIDSVTLPSSTPLAGLRINAVVASSGADTLGTLELDVYEIWIEATA